MKKTLITILLFLGVITAQSQEMLIHLSDGSVINLGILQIDSVTFNNNVAETVTDADGNTYNTIEIAGKVWMAENLNVGVMLSSTTSGQLQTDNSIVEKYCYENLESNCDTYGALYEWRELMQYNSSDNGVIGTVQGICPTGWHIPTDIEWSTLVDSLGNTNFDVGGKLKEVGETHWDSPNTGATNESGFYALPNGSRSYSSGAFSNLGYNGNFWTATEYDTNYSWDRDLYSNDADIYRYNTNKSTGLAVRCVKN